jgi:hypothetical protein
VVQEAFIENCTDTEWLRDFPYKQIKDPRAREAWKMFVQAFGNLETAVDSMEIEKK